VLLLDEPLSALDTVARDAVMTALLQWLGEHRIQTIVVTHDAADALRTQAEVVRLHEGRVAAQGAAMEVLAEERRRLLERLGATQ
jgi:ABC-type sulfate/molybdate transport systems ATPase subunit